MKILCFGVRQPEKILFESINKGFNYDLTLVSELLTRDNVEMCRNYDAVLLRANCIADEQNLLKLKSYGIKYILTRTVGTNHIDIVKAKTLGFRLAYVPNYSPNAVGELAFSLGNGLLRNLFYIANKTSKNNFSVDNNMFSVEVRNCTIGIIGTGKIAYTAAVAWKAMGAKIIGYSRTMREEWKNILTYVDLKTLANTADLISIHCPYIKDKNHHMINDELMKEMKDGVCIVNTSRGEIIDHQALLKWMLNGKIKSVALDVIENETAIFGQDLTGQKIKDDVIRELINLYPRVIITPHIGSYTDEAVKNMIEISFNNLKDFIDKKVCANEL
ncbi:MAG: lactate dehydrogenase [Mycoplasmataceae bacterium]|nr:lactate dehydrogenase [Mycoplasmataceae bacterium]